MSSRSKVKVDGIREPTHQDAAYFPKDHAVSERDFRCLLYCRIELQKELDSQSRLLRLVPCRCLVGFSLRTRLNVDADQALRNFARSCSRTSLHGRPGFGLARYSFNRSSSSC